MSEKDNNERKKAHHIEAPDAEPAGLHEHRGHPARGPDRPGLKIISCFYNFNNILVSFELKFTLLKRKLIISTSTGADYW